MRRLSLSVALGFAVAAAHAQVVRCVDASGRVRYVDASQAGSDRCAPLENRLEIVPAPPAGGAPPRPAAGAAPAAEEDRLQAAERRLAEAKKQLAEQEAVRYGEERNYARVLERLKPYQEAVENAQRELEQARQAR